ncbi:hypothetical protein ACHAW6_016097 [Cyclotella cf. meneghiniana]
MVHIAAGIGALGLAQAHFFIPLAKFEDYSKYRMSGVLVSGKGKQQINKRTQDVYACQMSHSIPHLLSQLQSDDGPCNTL